MAEKFIWLFHGTGATFASGVFETKELAEEWIIANKLEGVLTQYPINQGVYQWAIEKNYFAPTRDYQFEGKFIQQFTSASQEHYHYKNE